jgi:hypothetical protein
MEISRTNESVSPQNSKKDKYADSPLNIKSISSQHSSSEVDLYGYCPHEHFYLLESGQKSCTDCFEIFEEAIEQNHGSTISKISDLTPAQARKSANLLDKPMFWITAAICVVVGFWFGDYGLTSLIKGDCNFVYFDSGQFPSTSSSFICVSNVEVDAVHALGTKVYGHVPFAIVMQAASIFFILQGWIFVRKARLSS